MPANNNIASPPVPLASPSNYWTNTRYFGYWYILAKLGQKLKCKLTKVKKMPLSCGVTRGRGLRKDNQVCMRVEDSIHVPANNSIGSPLVWLASPSNYWTNPSW